MVVRIVVNGKAGKDGSIEHKASDGVGAGGHGCNGRNATAAERGEDGGRIDVSLSMQQNGEILLVGSTQPTAGGLVQNVGPKSTAITTDFELSAQGGAGGRGGTGGDGGNGKKGRDGRDATKHRSGENGGPGGDGGDAGAGTDGANGGMGGSIEVRISDEDSYLLLAVPCCEKSHHAVRGGQQGSKGRHGSPGTPGAGGRGGSSKSWTTTSGCGENKTTDHHHKRGGHTGPRGRKGRRVTHRLKDGQRGKDGKLSIHVNGEGSYDHRYDLCLADLSLQSPHRLQERANVFQFTDQIQITDMTCQNVGGMVSPSQGSNVHFTKATDYIIPDFNTMGWFQKRLQPQELGPVSGPLSFRIDPPRIRELGDDMEPFRVLENLYLGATQLGAHGFQRSYPLFHTNGTMLDFRFPVENRRKLEGLPTICAGEGTCVEFRVTNTSPHDLGSKSQDKRQLVVQFYRNGRAEYDIVSHHVDMQIDGVECNSKLDSNSAPVWRGTQLPIHFLKAGQTKIFHGTLKLSPQVTPYSRIGIQAEILLQKLDHSNCPASPRVIPIQRRQLEVTSEPTYAASPKNHVVLVSCSATNKEQFNAWSDLITERLGLNVEYYSVSIYGSLDPNFQPPNGRGLTLAGAFAGKLVIVLDDTFNPLDVSVSKMEPSRMLPNGCQWQTSGYDQSTQWLLVGSSDAAVKQALASHYTAPPNDVSTYESLSDFKKELQEQLRDERKTGFVSDQRICVASIQVKESRRQLKRSKQMDRKVRRAKSFLIKADPLRQYIMEPRCQVEEIDGKVYRKLIVRRGYCRTANTSHVLKRARPPEKGDKCALLAVLGTLPTDSLHLVLTKAVAAEDTSLQDVALDVITQHLLWEVANVIDGKLNVRHADSENPSSIFPMLSAATHSSTLRELSASPGTGKEVLSRLVARFECVARSRDLNPWYQPFSMRHRVRKKLLQMIKALKREWAAAISKDTEIQEIQAVEKRVLQHLRKTYGFPTVTRLRSRWRKGLLYICSYRNEDEYVINANTCGPTFRLCEMETQEHTKKSRAIAPSKTVATEHECCILRQQADNQKAMAAQLLQSITETRGRQGLGNDEEIEIEM